MNWYETEDKELLNLEKINIINHEGFGFYVARFSDRLSCEISETDYENIKNILLNGGK